MDLNIRDRRAVFTLAKGWDKPPSRWNRALQWLDDVRVHGNRLVLGLIIGLGAVASLGLGMLFGGALEGVDVALPPPAHPGPGPIIAYASPTTTPRTHHTSRPATAASGSKTSSSSTSSTSATSTTSASKSSTTTGTFPGVSNTPTTTTPGKTPSPTTTTPPTPTTTKPPSNGGGGSANNPLMKLLGL